MRTGYQNKGWVVKSLANDTYLVIPPKGEHRGVLGRLALARAIAQVLKGTDPRLLTGEGVKDGGYEDQDEPGDPA